MGFYTDLPENSAVHSKKSAVYKAYFPFPPLYTLSKEQLLKVDLNAINPKESDFIGKRAEYVQSLLFKRQIEDCIMNIDEKCFLFGSFVRGSLFFAQDNKTIFTAFHNVEGIINGQLQILKTLEGVDVFEPIGQKLAIESHFTKNVKEVDPFKVPELIELYKELRTKKAPIVIENSEGEIIFGLNPSDNYESMDFKPELLYSTFGINMLKSYRDFTRIKISQPLGNPLTIATEEVYKEPRYLLGYPQKQDRSHLNKPSSDGESFYFSKGKALNVFDAEKRAGKDFNTSKEENERILKQLSYCDCDGTGGFSGGAAVNGRGEVSFITAEALLLDQNKANKDNVLLYGPRMTFVLEVLDKQDQLLFE